MQNSQRQKNQWEKRQRKQREQKKRAEAAAKGKKKAATKVDEDNDGWEKLEEVENPLEEASKFALSLDKWCSDRLDSHLLCFEVFYKKKKYLRALRSLKKATAMEPANPNVHMQLIQLSLVDVSEIDEACRGIFESELKKLTNGSNAKELNEKYSKENTGYLNRIAVARASILIDPENKNKVKETICAFEDNATRTECEYVLSVIKKLYESEVDTFKAASHAKYPYASAFE